MGTGSKILTVDVQETICRFVEAGNYAEYAAICAGVKPHNYYYWMQKGRQAISEQNYEDQYAIFVYAIKNAEAKAQAESIIRIRAASRGGELVRETTVTRPNGTAVTTREYSRPDWTSAAWYLERKYPDLWGRRERVDRSVRAEAEKVAKELGVSTEEFLAEVQKAHEARAKS